MVINPILMAKLDPRYTYYGNIIINPILMAGHRLQRSNSLQKNWQLWTLSDVWHVNWQFQAGC
jgi:hypothetical protein